MFKSFDDLFRYATTPIGENPPLIERPNNYATFLIRKQRINFEFNIWLREKKGWKEEDQYSQFLNKKTFKEFLSYCREQDDRVKKDKDLEYSFFQLEISKRKKTTAITFALAYYFECEALDDRPYKNPNYTNKMLEDDLHKRYNGKKSGNSIRKALDVIKNKGNNMRYRDTIEGLAGYQDWEQDVLVVTAYPDKVADYIKNNLEP